MQTKEQTQRGVFSIISHTKSSTLPEYVLKPSCEDQASQDIKSELQRFFQTIALRRPKDVHSYFPL